MSPTTRFLCRFYGLFLMVAAAAMLAGPADMAVTVDLFVRDRAAMLLLGYICLAGGLATLLVHSGWRGGAAPVCVTLLGWMSLAKGLLTLFLPAPDMQAIAFAVTSPGWYVFSGAVCLGLGAFLAYAGFRAASILPDK